MGGAQETRNVLGFLPRARRKRAGKLTAPDDSGTEAGPLRNSMLNYLFGDVFGVRVALRDAELRRVESDLRDGSLGEGPTCRSPDGRNEGDVRGAFV